MEEVNFEMQDLSQTQQYKHDLEKELIDLMRENKDAILKNDHEKINSQKSYFQRAKEILFDSLQPDDVINRIWDPDLSMGVCAKPLKQGDIAWKCEDCELDPFRIICLDCFNNSNHEGHRTILKTNVSGCCDCGDPEGWPMDVACDKHKGIDSAKDAALNALPAQIRDRSPHVMRALTKALKELLLIVLSIDRTADVAAQDQKRCAEKMIRQFLDESTKLLQNWKQCIFYLSDAYLEIFPGEFVLPADHKHQCCYRYYPDAEFRAKIEKETAIYESSLEGAEPQRYCTCTVVDLLFIADQKFNIDFNLKLQKKITQQCIQLFQSSNYKQHLCFSYIANMPEILSCYGQMRGVAQLGVQILTMDSVTSKVFSDPKLTQMVSNTLKDFLHKTIESKGEDRGAFQSASYMRYDLKYIAKPDLMPQLIRNTTIVEQFLDAISQFHLSDVQIKSNEMAEFGDYHLQYLFMFAQVDLEISRKIESKYLSFITRKEDFARIFKYFQTKFTSVYAAHINQHSDKGAFIIPLHRGFAYILSRMLMKHYTLNQLSNEDEEIKTCNEKDLPPTNFHSHLMELELFEDASSLQKTLEEALFSAAKQMGFIAEIDSNKWIYKGEYFRTITKIERDAYYEKYLRMIALFQASICASAFKSRCIDVLLNNFGTDDWLSVYYTSLADVNGPCKEMFDGLSRFSVEKLALQVQQLFLKLIEIAITEASFLLPAQKKLFLEKNEQQGAKKVDAMIEAHLRREMMHVLFSKGANATIDQIKQGCHDRYLKSDQFTNAVIDLSTSITDNNGRKQFRLNTKSKHEAMFDPYYIVKKNQQSATQTAYEQFYKNNKNCNNIVGDYQAHYKYQTSINRECREGMAQSSLLAEIVSKTVKECLNVRLQASKTPDDFKQELFPQQTLNMGLKLLLIISENCGDQRSEVMRKLQEVLPSQLMSEAFSPEHCKDTKLRQIGLHIKNLIHRKEGGGADPDTPNLKEKTSSEQLAVKKQLQNKKKAALLAKMKKKQNKFVTAAPTKAEVGNPEEAKVGTSAFQGDMQVDSTQTCASCQEPIDVEKFFERPFAQLCLLSQTKLLYYTYQQTVQSQIQSLKNLRHSQDYSEEMYLEETKNEERKSDTVQQLSQSERDSQFDVSGDTGVVMPEDPHIEWNRLVMQDLQLHDVIDEKYKTGVSFSKCCHALHLDCLIQYQTSEGQTSHHMNQIRQMVGFDEGNIQCPVCKSFKNTWQPFLPLGLDLNQTKEDCSNPIRVTPYIDYCSQLISNQLNNAHEWNDAGPNRIFSPQILAVDIQKHPEEFILRMCAVVTHFILERTCLTNQELFKDFDANAQQDGIILREIVYILMTVREILQRLLSPDDKMASQPNKTEIDDLAQLMLGKLVSKVQEQSTLEQNLPKLIIQFLFISAVMLPLSRLREVAHSTITSLYASLKAQIIVAEAFRKNFGQLIRGQAPQKVQEALEQAQRDCKNESLVESQLTFLRSATAMSLSINALFKTYELPTAQLSSTSTMQLNLDQEFMKVLCKQVDDQSEFSLMVNHLGLNASFESHLVLEKPSNLTVSEEDEDNFLYFSIINLSGFLASFQQTVVTYAQSAPSINLPGKSDEDMPMEHFDDDLIGIPQNLHLLTAYFTFNLIELPPDFNRLVKQYYTKQCRACRKQLKESAICLLCGEIVCLDVDRKCCTDRPGMKKLVSRNQIRFSFSGNLGVEGELSYHARYCEGGNSIFLVPQDANIFTIDQGRIFQGDSPYRNALGEAYSPKSVKWANYELSEESGGAQVMRLLRKNYLEHKLPMLTLQGRQSSERVIPRHFL